MRYLKQLFKYLFYLLLVPIFYVLVSLLLSAIPVNKTQNQASQNKHVYLTTNGVHLDIVIPVAHLSQKLKDGLVIGRNTNYLAFGWGDENFYLNTPTWGDLTFQNAFGALFLNSSTLVHVTRYNNSRQKWVKVALSEAQLQKLNANIQNIFKLDSNKSKQILNGKGYGFEDDFYKAKGSYSIFKTCNSWVNTTFKQSDLKACLWTPFDFSLLNKYN